jgi:2-dehydro-3-deoxyphosphogluconate aldolase/(4S)-4-hydroxy-2-oxoglutarate aldolase
MNAIEPIMRMGPVIPVLVIDNVESGVQIAEALVAGGLRVLEVTLRTTAALDVIRAMKQVPGAVVGAGTVLNIRDLDAAIAAGAEFIVSPGLTEKLAHAALDREIPFLPGVANASDIMRGLDLGLDRFKFFPAEAAGGLKALKALAAPFRNVRFCPTGGITLASAPEWLSEEAVLCVGGSWLVGKGAPGPIAIQQAAAAAAGLGQPT